MGNFIAWLLKRELEKQLPPLIDGIFREIFAEKPDQPVNSVGFTWALVLEFEDAWPDIDRKTALSCARDCLEIPHGTPGYDWTPAAAKHLVEEYVNAFGEEIQNAG